MKKKKDIKKSQQVKTGLRARLLFNLVLNLTGQWEFDSKRKKTEFGQKINSHSCIHILEYSTCCPRSMRPGFGPNFRVWISSHTYTSEI